MGSDSKGLVSWRRLRCERRLIVYLVVGFLLQLKETQMGLKITKLNIFVQEALMVGTSIVLGIWVASRLHELFEIEMVEPPSLTPGLIFFYIIVGTIFLLVFTKAFRKFSTVSYQIIFAIVIFGGLNIFFSTFLLPQIALPLALFLTFYRLTKPTIVSHNLVIVLSIAGVGGTLGLSLTPFGVIILLAILSVYDVIAVYKTKHMVRIAQEMIQARAILGLIIPEAWRSHRAHPKEAKPGQGFMFLGGGDIVMPTLFAASVWPQGLVASIMVAVFALIGLLADHLFFTTQAERKPIPALPLIAGFSVAGYGLFWLVERLF